jgi:TolB-like protein/tetratricopeptide (TPR) repeat protein/class 3 adenylate cyclase
MTSGISSASPSELKFEIGHVLFIDIVGYSQLLINKQSEQLDILRKIVRGTEQFRAAEAEGKLFRLPTGDGAALVFRTTPEAPVLCALEISKELKKHPELRVRMGIHSGPVNAVTDLNEQSNIAGAGINIAQRIMDCGDAGHILLSKHVAEDLEHYLRWKPYLHDLGECEVKHGIRVSVVNLYTDDTGNPALPEKFESAQQKLTEAEPKLGKPMLLAIGIGGLLVIAIFVSRFVPGVLRSNEEAKRAPAEALAIPAKSIAVLPFGNLSRDPDNAYFVEGIQDEILTRLSKIADLKVISRTSTQKYKSAPDNLRDVARELGVANILEGSVQKSNDQVRVNVQLINALTDAHLWADTYDRKLTDIFAVESEIAKTIAETLQAKLSGLEKTAMSKKPTANQEAYELYLKGRFFWNKRTGDDLRKSIEYLKEAIAKDPGYALAYAGLADSYGLLRFYGGASPAESIVPATAAAKKALELDDSLAEPHASLGLIATEELDVHRGVEELERAIQLNPNYATAHHWLALAFTALGQSDRSIAETKRALELDPLSMVINADLSIAYLYARRYDEAEAQASKTLEIDPRSFLAHYYLGMALQLKGRLEEAIPEFQKAVELNHDPYCISMLAQGYARNGQTDEARKLLAQLNEMAKSAEVPEYAFALIYTSLGDKDHAIAALEHGFAGGNKSYLFLLPGDPLLDDLRGDPRFEALVQKVVAPKSEAKQ